MFEDRGYIIPKKYKYLWTGEGKHEPPPEFIDWVGDDVKEARKMLHLVFSKESGASIATFWSQTLGIDVVQQIENTLKELGITNGFVVHITKVSACAASAIRSLRVQKINIEDFFESELQFNISRHVDVPKHIICSSAKRDEILKKYAIKKECLPQLKFTDPMRRYLGAQRGHLIKIVRPSDTMPSVVINGKEKLLYDISYRIVV